MRADLATATRWTDVWLGAPDTLASLGPVTVGELRNALGDGRALVVRAREPADALHVALFVDEKPPSALTRSAGEWTTGVVSVGEHGLALAPARRAPEPSAIAKLASGRYTVRQTALQHDDAAREARLAALVGPDAMNTVRGHRRWLEISAVALGLGVALALALTVGWWMVLAGPLVGFIAMRLLLARAKSFFRDHPAWQALAAGERRLAAEQPDVIVVLERA